MPLSVLCADPFFVVVLVADPPGTTLGGRAELWCGSSHSARAVV